MGGFLAGIGQLFGLPKSVGQVYGLLYISPDPLGFSAIVERLETSKGSASQGLQLLQSLGAINEAAIPSILMGAPRSSRSIAYKPELSLRQLVTGVMSERIAPLASAGANRLKHLKRLAEQSPIHPRSLSRNGFYVCAMILLYCFIQVSTINLISLCVQQM